MLAESGYIALWLALGLSSVQLASLCLRPSWGQYHFLRRSSVMQCALLLWSMVALAGAFYLHDFSLQYVAQHSNRLLPWYYRISAVWGGHEGSLLLWLWILSAWTAAVAWRLPRHQEALDAAFYSKALGVLAGIQLGFLVFILSSSNPFLRQFPMPFDGQDLNPLLQDPGLIFHPPLLYAGYVGFAVAFAFVVAALWLGQLSRRWLQFLRPWVLWAWLCLTLGIALGSYWAYYELGWGGWWFWDPVENASFMPWLVGSALIHSLSISERRTLLLIWSSSLAILTFALSLIGTFLVRSGVLTSVHAFASDPTRGIAILLLLAVITLPAIALLLFRAHRLQARRHYRLFSRDGALLLNNWLFSGAFLVVFVGTLYPLLLDLLNWGKISVGAPYFNRFIVPLSALSLFLLALGQHLRWQGDRYRRVLKIQLPLLLLALALSMFISRFLSFNGWAFQALLSLMLWACLSTLFELGQRLLYATGSALRRRFIGMSLAHLGYIIMIFGMAATGWFAQEFDRRLKVGDSMSIGEYRLSLQQLEALQGENYRSTVGRFLLEEERAFVAVLRPEKRQYFSSTMPLSESARHITLRHDVYLAMGEEIEQGVWAVRVQYKPYIIWIWLGAVLMALGALCAAGRKKEMQ